uniref:Centrosomal protein 295 n=1 Tax=Panthera tigris altaica TaxID=74533 RepID=A0A8C9KVC6_PANTA
PLPQDLAGDDQENIRPVTRSNCDDNQLLSESSAQQSGKIIAFYYRDPLRVSISREQSFFGSPLDCEPFGCLYPVAQENVCGANSSEAVKVKEAVTENDAILSYAVEEEHTYLSPPVKPHNAETEEIYHEPLSSITVSTGSFLSYENTDLSLTDAGSFSEHASDHREQEPTTAKEEETNVLSSVVPASQVSYQRQDPGEVHKPVLPAVEKFTSGQTHFQQMMEKHINEANLMTEKTDLREHTFPNLHHQLFKPLEPHPDFDMLSSYSGISQDSRDFYQNSDSSWESHRTTVSSKSTASFTALRTSLNPSNTSPNQQPDPHLAHAAAQIFATENITEGSEQSFQQLLPEFSSQEGSQHVDLPSIFSIEARGSFQSMENQNYSAQTELQNRKKSVPFQLSVGNLQNSGFRSSDEANVFHHLNLQHSTPCGSTSSECSIKAQPEGREETLGSEKLSERGIDTMLQSQGLNGDKKETCGVLNINSEVEEIDSQLCLRTVGMGTSVQAPYSVQNEKYFENSAKAETPEILRNLSQLAQSELFLSSGSLQSSIPMWLTESGHGIMEEPELTLVSTSDISIAEMEFANLTLEEKKENEAKSSFQVNEFVPLTSEKETSDHPVGSEHCVEEPVAASPSHSPQSRRLPAQKSVPGSLQEAFVKRKKSFIERSSQRQKEIKNKIYLSEKSQIKTAKEKPTGSSVSRLKGVNKVRVSLPEDRKTAQTLMRQRALRLYNQLAEVKQQREEKAKQDAYAQNRARAKEFHKKTLEKLRAKNTC